MAYKNLLKEDMMRLFNDEEFSDLEIFCESKKFYVHRALLASRCKYFRKQFYTEREDDEKNEYQTFGLKESPKTNYDQFKLEHFENFLLYLYGGACAMNIQGEYFTKFPVERSHSCGYISLLILCYFKWL